MLADEKILNLFYARSEQAIWELDRKYGKVCHQISWSILKSRQDAEECVNDAYLGAWNAIPPAKPDSLQAYLYRIVRNLSLKIYYSKVTAKRSSYEVAMEELGDCLASRDMVEEEIEAMELSHIIEEFLDTLPIEHSVIFMRRYWFSDTYAEIAVRMGITEKNVSVRLARIRKKLREYLLERGVIV